MRNIDLIRLNELLVEVPENPLYNVKAVEAAAQRGCVVVPWSGGLDSTTAVLMALETGANVRLLSVSAGQPWDVPEARARYFVKDALPQLKALPHHAVMLPDAPLIFDHIHVGRNVAIVRAARDLLLSLKREPLWAEIWLGWLHGEVPLAGGDKSHTAAALMQTMMPAGWLVHYPTATYTKADLVGWWIHRGMIEQAATTYSCFEPGPLPCGRCQACFRTFVAFAWWGEHERLMAWGKADFSEPIRKYRKAMTSGGRYLTRRVEQTMSAIGLYEQERGRVHDSEDV